MGDSKERDLISIIIPIYNVENYLDECLKSIVNQSYKNIEIILVDDGSTDSSLSICNRWASDDKRIKVFHQKNKGSSVARNKGIVNSTGKFICFVDSDDIALEQYVEVLYSNIKIIKGKYYLPQILLQYFDHNGLVPLKKDNDDYGHLNKREFMQALLEKRVECSMCSAIFPKNFFESVRFPNGKLNEDFFVWLKLIETQDDFGGIIKVNKVYYHYRIRQGSNSRAGYNSCIRDSVYNALYAKKIVKERYPELVLHADLLCYLQIELLFRVIPLEYMNNRDRDYCVILRWIRRHFISMLKNPLLGKHEKRNLLAMIFLPKTSKIIYERVIGWQHKDRSE